MSKNKNDEIEEGNNLLVIISLLIIIIYGLFIPLFVKYIFKKNIYFFTGNTDKFLTIVNLFLLIIPFLLYIIGIIIFFTQKEKLKNSSKLRGLTSIFIGKFSSIVFLFFIDLLYNHIRIHGKTEISGQTHYQFIFFIFLKIIIFFCFYLNGIMMVEPYIKKNYLGPPQEKYSKTIVNINKVIISISIIIIMFYCMYWIKNSKSNTISIRKFQVASIGTFLAGGAAVINLLTVLGIFDKETGYDMISQSI